ncbi:MAG: hypothetical protein CSA81_12245 [Acidobacteria bacterium]|nr:MAG: hypothetical protein CSA81_12245 [Acidobacteriota bacterium]
MYPKNTNYLKEVRAKKLTWTLDKDKYNIYSPGHIDYTRMTLVDSLYLCEIIALHEKKDAYFVLISISKKFVANTGVISWNDDEVCYVFALKFNKKGELEKVKFWEGF